MAWLESLTKVGFFETGIVSYLIIFLILTLILLYIFKGQQKMWIIDQIPGPKTVPLFGNALDLNANPADVFERLMKFCDCNQNGQIVRMWIGFRPYVLIFKPDAAKVILSSTKHIDKSSDYTYLYPWLGTGLLTSTGRKWQHRRKLLTPSFHFKILEDFLEVFNKEGAKFVRNLEANADGKLFDIFKPISLCTLDIILETAMGTSINAQDNSESDYVKALYKIGNLVQKRQFRPWLQPEFMFKLLGLKKKQDQYLDILHGFSNRTIKERKTERQKRKEIERKSKKENKVEEEELMFLGKRKRLAFLDLLLESAEENSNFSDEDIREEVDTFMFEGQDTTAAAINWSIYLLGSYPEIQAKVHEEMDAIFGDSDRPATMDDIREMKMLDCCIKEALRIFPSVPFIGRELQEDAEIDGYKIPAGTTTLIITYRLHRDPEQFPDPESFQPERFLLDNASARHPYAYIPFSAGPRNCIGQKFAQMEEKVVVSSFFRKYRVETSVKREDIKLIGELVLRPENGTQVKIFPRK